MKKVITFLLQLAVVVLVGALAIGMIRERVVRIPVGDALETSVTVADQLKSNLRVKKFNTILVARDDSFPDALSGSCLASAYSAPILLVGEETVWEIRAYIEENIAEGGTVYLLGDEEVVPDLVTGGLFGITVKRLGGTTRLDTNLQILQEMGVTGGEIMVCSGWSYADALSAAVLNRPLLLVGESLTEAQREFLSGCSDSMKFYIIGGTAAVGKEVADELAQFGTIMRISGETRCDTSVNVARKFFSVPESVVLLYSHDFVQGLCAIPLAVEMNAPLILTNENDAGYCIEYMKDLGIRSGTVLADEDTLSDDLIVRIFRLNDPSAIKTD